MTSATYPTGVGPAGGAATYPIGLIAPRPCPGVLGCCPPLGGPLDEPPEDPPVAPPEDPLDGPLGEELPELPEPLPLCGLELPGGLELAEPSPDDEPPEEFQPFEDELPLEDPPNGLPDDPPDDPLDEPPDGPLDGPPGLPEPSGEEPADLFGLEDPAELVELLELPAVGGLGDDELLLDEALEFVGIL